MSGCEVNPAESLCHLRVGGPVPRIAKPAALIEGIPCPRVDDGLAGQDVERLRGRCSDFVRGLEPLTGAPRLVSRARAL